ncbi:hypothetical protein RCT12_18030, partial [Escherichia coli]|nr:hypothetical protein [Escherichia coli]
MSGMENTWDAPTWVLPNDRYLEYTHPDIKAEFGSLNDQVVTRLKSFPALFVMSVTLILRRKLVRLRKLKDVLEN